MLVCDVFILKNFKKKVIKSFQNVKISFLEQNPLINNLRDQGTPAAATPKGVPPPPAPCAVPPPPPPPCSATSAPKPATKPAPDMSALLSQLNQGSDVTKGLDEIKIYLTLNYCFLLSNTRQFINCFEFNLSKTYVQVCKNKFKMVLFFTLFVD